MRLHIFQYIDGGRNRSKRNIVLIGYWRRIKVNDVSRTINANMSINAIANRIVLKAKIELAIEIERCIYERYLFIDPDEVGEYRFKFSIAKNAIILNSNELGNTIEGSIRQ